MDEPWLFKLLSVLGALAWLPSIIEALKSWLTRPKLSIIPDRSVEIGYTANGHVVNLRFAFTTEKKEALIRKISLVLKHERNDTHTFLWEWFEEDLMHIETSDSGPIPYKKNQRAIAIKVLVDNLIEKKVGFHEEEFKSNYNIKLMKFRDTLHKWKLQEKDLTQFKVTNEYSEFHDHIKNSFSWKIGIYSATIKVYTDDLNNESAKTMVQFSLSSLDLKYLEQNISLTQEFIDKNFIDLNNNYLPTWNWVYPKINEI